MSHTERYSRQLLLDEIGAAGQQRLHDARVLVIGAGGLGTPVLQYLAGAGVGTLSVIDGDVVQTSNLHRQVLYRTEDIGRNKARAAQAHLQALNPDIRVQAYPENLTTANALDILGGYDIVVDGTDNFTTRYLVNDACLLLDKPLVYGAIYKFQGQVAVFNHQHGPSYRCLFPQPPKPGEVPSCSDIGVLGVLPGIIGSLQANEALKLILGIGELLSGRLLTYDALTNRTDTFRVPRNEAVIQRVLESREHFAQTNYEAFCGQPEVRTMDAAAALDLPQARFVDIREPHERPEVSEVDPLTIPMSQLETHAKALPTDRPLVLFCQSGQRSRTAAEMLKSMGFQDVYSLTVGAAALQQAARQHNPQIA